MAGPGDWGAVPLEQTGGLDTGPAAWGAQPLTGKPLFGTDEYVKDMAKRHGVDEGTVRTAAHSQYSGHVLGGTPIAGAFIPQAGAAISAAAAPVTGKGVQAPTFGERYSKELALQKELAEDYEHDHPILSTASQVGGAALTTGLAGLTGAGAKALGAVEGGLAKQTLASAASGAGIGAVDAAARGQDPGSAAAWGAGLGTLGPAVGRLTTQAYQAANRVLRGGAPSIRPQNIYDVGGVSVPLTSGEASRDFPTQQFEQGAQQGALGEAAQRAAQDFRTNEQAPQVEAARQGVGTSMDPAGQIHAQDPQQAGEMVSRAIQENEARSRQNYQNLYQQALQQPGDIHASAFRGIGQRIQQDLSNRASPVIVDDVTTPVASRALQDLQNTIDRLSVQNRASPHGQPDPNTVVGINLQGVDQARKRLISMASAAMPGSADRRAVSGVIQSFDGQVEDAISNRLFTGQSDQALAQLRQARQAYSTHAGLFKSQVSDEGVGRIIERITGRNGYDGSTPTEIANWLYGNAKIGATGTSYRVAQRVRDIVGEDSPAWVAVKQGLWQRLTAKAEGVNPMGTQAIANRISEFLNGSGAPLAQTMFSAQERQLMGRFASLMQQLTPLPRTVNDSGTAPMLGMMARQLFRTITGAIGAGLVGPAAHMVGGPIAAGVAGLAAHQAGARAGERIMGRAAAARVVKSFYQTPAHQQAEARLAEQAGRYGAVVSKMAQGGFHPAMVGARQAPDGQHYLDDPTRPGKYLRVDSR